MINFNIPRPCEDLENTNSLKCYGCHDILKCFNSSKTKDEQTTLGETSKELPRVGKQHM